MRENIFVLLKKLLDRAMEFITVDREYAETIMDTITSLRSELECVREENRWIPVSERLPEITDTYIVAMILPSKKVISVCRYYCLETDSWDSSRAPFITHWRPLPTAPEEG